MSKKTRAKAAIIRGLMKGACWHIYSERILRKYTWLLETIYIVLILCQNSTRVGEMDYDRPYFFPMIWPLWAMQQTRLVGKDHPMSHINLLSCRNVYINVITIKINCCYYHSLGNGVIKSLRVEKVMEAVDRKNYCPYEYAPYQDSPQSIG